MLTVYVSIGNSDDKLTQARWALFRGTVNTLVHMHATQIHGEWTSISHAAWQNACWAFEIEEAKAEVMKSDLSKIRADFDQDSVAWALAETEFI